MMPLLPGRLLLKCTLKPPTAAPTAHPHTQTEQQQQQQQQVAANSVRINQQAAFSQQQSELPDITRHAIRGASSATV
jgi:hypothetical protein